jgi:hypothetical protein
MTNYNQMAAINLKSNQKTMRLILSLFLFVALFSCSKSDPVKEDNSNNPIAEQFASSNVPEQKVMYGLFAANEKNDLWKAKYAMILSQNTSLTKEQRKFVIEVYNYLKPELFIDGSDYRNQFATSKEREIRNKAIQLFGFERGRWLLTDPTVPSETAMYELMPAPEDGGDYSLKCQCSTKSSYCGSNYDCVSSSCEQSEGCGTFWTYTCNGRCVI